jgi:ferritin
MPRATFSQPERARSEIRSPARRCPAPVTGQLPGRAPTREFADHVAPITLALEQERRVTVQISKLLELARETNDHPSERFIQGFVEEQVEEEATIQDLLTVAERTREIPVLLEEYLARDKPGRHAGS